ncbi:MULTISPECIES: hypothetical protein [Serratia]|uniref:hypothetical protein n=1 Tax=Serratia TaxID=613 RepID=UPI001A1C8EEC|nr:hypothetical protein [Serratia marcescens]EGT3596290.1 hypothetical protein [Serratia marcescens]MDP8626438.1 hypothetical protein [Serratia marcescens]MDP8675872.1 hypothetical protein [Serratia marcescens]MDP8690875.1 hypothetical protein [Serratia marcescens]MDP8700533.1 hypothetical protein [Serratia marcescens]
MNTKIEKVYIGETIVYYQDVNESTTLVSPSQTKIEITQTSTPISTVNWESGMWTQILKDDMSIKAVSTFVVVDPLETTTRYQDLLKTLKEIDEVIAMRISGGLITTTTINNKTLVNESLEVLYRLKEQYTQQANKELLKLNGKSGDGKQPIKSITKLHRGNH